MIGVLLHLAALAPAAVATHVASAALSLLGHGTPDPSEVDQLGAECDALRAERDEARARVAELRGILRESRALTHEAEGERDDARTLAHEAKLEAAEVRAQLEELRALMRKFLIVREAYMSCEPGARADYDACLADMRAAVEEVKP